MELFIEYSKRSLYRRSFFELSLYSSFSIFRYISLSNFLPFSVIVLCVSLINRIPVEYSVYMHSNCCRVFLFYMVWLDLRLFPRILCRSTKVVLQDTWINLNQIYSKNGLYSIYLNLIFPFFLWIIFLLILIPLFHYLQSRPNLFDLNILYQH